MCRTFGIYVIYFRLLIKIKVQFIWVLDDSEEHIKRFKKE